VFPFMGAVFTSNQYLRRIFMKKHRLTALTLPLFLLTGAFAVGCTENSDTNDSTEADVESVATAHAELTSVPAGVLCVRVVAGATTKNFTVTSGASSLKLDLGQLPVGWQSTSATAYNVACPSGAAAPTANPTWVSDTAYVVVSANSATTVPIVLRPALSASASVDFRPSPSTIATGYIASYAVTPDGSAWTWGYDQTGVTGLGVNAYVPKPTKIASLSNVKEIAAGSGNACALLNDGTVRCWGSNSSGQLGDGTTTDRQSPVKVSGLSGVTTIASGYHHVCALQTDGTMRCWGRNDFGQLGNNTYTNALTPVLTTSGRVLAISAGYLNSCVISTERIVYCVGDNYQGQLGNGSPSVAKSSYFGSVGAIGGGVSSIKVGGNSVFAIRADNKVYAWGGNAYGQLGDGTTTSRFTPVAVGSLAGATQVSVGEVHGCALMAAGTVTCWGTNYSNRLGNGNTDSIYTPTPVLNLTNAVQISTHYSHACARTTTGDVYCWGEGMYGQIGDNLLATAAVPTRVLF
jgi:alpha-tubulin suppressor-like RCC1 family protein